MSKNTMWKKSALITLALLGLAACSKPAAKAPADLILNNGYVYTVDSSRSVAEAVAIRGNRIIAVGSSSDVLEHRGPETDVRDLGGLMVLPGLHDMHIHVTDTVAADFCSFDNVSMSLEEIVDFARACVEERKPGPGDWLPIVDWDPYQGNEPSAANPTILAALDSVSADIRIVLWASDGHSAAANSAALNAPDIPVTAESLATTYSDIASYVPLGADGTPTGRVNEDVRHMLRDVDIDFMKNNMPPGTKMPLVAEGLARNGITSVQHPHVHPAAFADLVWLAREGDMTFRLRMALGISKTPSGTNWIEEEIDRIIRLRESVADLPSVQVNGVKIFGDDVLEGDPYATPPSPPNSAMIDGFLSPQFQVDDDGSLEITGYEDVAEKDRHFGRLTYSAEDLTNLVQAATEAGFHTHIHVIGDHAAKNAADAFAASHEAAQAAGLTHSIAHMQIAKTEDVQRFGKLGVFGAFTYLWATPEAEYEALVVPFIDEVDGMADLYNPDHYYTQNAYPFRTFVDAGGIAVFGSDAPVGNRSSRPFRNMKAAMTRESDGLTLNASQVLDIHETLAAFTINGAQLMGHDDELGSIETGKIADLAIIDRNLVDLAAHGDYAAIRDASVVTTIFDGRVIYEAE